MGSQKYKKVQKTQKTQNTRKANDTWLKDFIGMVCGMGVYVFLFFLMVCYTFYAPEGYIMIATNKYQFFRKMCIVTAWIMIPLILLYYISYFIEKGKTLHDKGIRLLRSFSITDLFVLFFAAVNLITYYLTDYREEALWGTDGWYMGLAMQLFFVGIYFFMSRFYDGMIDVLVPFMAVTFVIFMWGLLNRFSVYPVDMHYSNVSFLSCMGNINWFCGFWSVFFSVGIVIYLVTEKKWLRILSGVHAAVSLGLGVVEGSDSGFLAMGIVFVFLFFVCFRNAEYMKRLLEIGIYLCIVCQIMRIVTIAAPESMNFSTALSGLMLGNLTLMVLVILAALWFLLDRWQKQYLKKGSLKKMEETAGWKWLEHGAAGLIAAACVLYLILLAVNTNSPGSIGALSRYSKVFLFDNDWGSKRGATWQEGIGIFKTFSPMQKLFGVGQDCFSAYAYSVPEIAQQLQEQWNGQRLTNAHNECITYLVNTGILGLVSFIGIFASSIVRLVQKAKKEPLCYVFAASALAYFFHNQFSFSQVENIPFVFMMMGLGENLMRRTEEKYPVQYVKAKGKQP